jgi:predicted DNA-binding protein
MDNNNGKVQPVNLKLPKDIKEQFKRISHDKGTSMQNLLLAFVNAYIENPEKFKIKMEIAE